MGWTDAARKAAVEARRRHSGASQYINRVSGNLGGPTNMVADSANMQRMLRTKAGRATMEARIRYNLGGGLIPKGYGSRKRY